MKRYSITLKTPKKCPFRRLFQISDLEAYCGVREKPYFYCGKLSAENNLHDRKCNNGNEFPDFCPLTEIEE